MDASAGHLGGAGAEVGAARRPDLDAAAGAQPAARPRAGTGGHRVGTRALELDEEWAQAVERLRSIPGVGIITAAWLLVATLNFTLCESAEAATSYAGLAPHPRQSGTSVRGKPTIGHTGNGRLRTALYLATLSASQHNPVIKGFYERLREAGKPVKVARCAAARKLLHIAWAVGTSGERFDPEYQPKQQQGRAVA